MSGYIFIYLFIAVLFFFISAPLYTHLVYLTFTEFNHLRRVFLVPFLLHIFHVQEVDVNVGGNVSLPQSGRQGLSN